MMTPKKSGRISGVPGVHKKRGKDRFACEAEDLVMDLHVPEGKEHPKIPKEQAMEFIVPEPSDILARIAAVRARLDGEERSITEWRAGYKAELTANLHRPGIAIFNRFVNSLLERAMLGEAWSRRSRALQQVFVGYDAVTEESSREVLRASGYRWGPDKGAAVIVGAKGLATAEGFTWQEYLRRAEDHYESDFQDDEFLAIANVNFKTRDLALSELSDRFVVIDLHVVRVTSRTALLLHGYGDPRITTEVGGEQGYLFFHDLMLKLARRTGWQAAGYSPGEIDRMFWHFGRAVCKAIPACRGCPLASTCLTFPRGREEIPPTRWRSPLDPPPKPEFRKQAGVGT